MSSMRAQRRQRDREDVQSAWKYRSHGESRPGVDLALRACGSSPRRCATIDRRARARRTERRAPRPPAARHAARFTWKPSVVSPISSRNKRAGVGLHEVTGVGRGWRARERAAVAAEAARSRASVSGNAAQLSATNGPRARAGRRRGAARASTSLAGPRLAQSSAAVASPRCALRTRSRHARMAGAAGDDRVRRGLQRPRASTRGATRAPSTRGAQAARALGRVADHDPGTPLANSSRARATSAVSTSGDHCRLAGCGGGTQPARVGERRLEAQLRSRPDSAPATRSRFERRGSAVSRSATTPRARSAQRSALGAVRRGTRIRLRPWRTPLERRRRSRASRMCPAPRQARSPRTSSDQAATSRALGWSPDAAARSGVRKPSVRTSAPATSRRARATLKK